MTREHSYGIIALREGKTLFVKHQKGHWAFPKGHADQEERPKETAARELTEETGLHVTQFLDLPPLEEAYQFQRGDEVVEKGVTYFFAEVAGELALQREEIADARWLTFEEAAELATFPQMRALCLQAHQRLKAP